MCGGRRASSFSPLGYTEKRFESVHRVNLRSVAETFKFSILRGAENEKISGLSVVQGRGCGVHPGGVAAPGPCSEDPVQRCDTGELQPPRLSGVLLYKTPPNLHVGTRRKSMVVKGRIPKQEPHRVLKHFPWACIESSPHQDFYITTIIDIFYSISFETFNSQNGLSVVQGRGCGVHPGGVAAPGPCSEDPVQRCDAGELQPPCLSGVLLNETTPDLHIRTRRKPMVIRGRISKQKPCRILPT
ncbi:uncharacterized protein [Dasypus novemcinctus]|uniref:uncharacterized protein isoform X4 n=2 Tax=Dasypus novemcinctus TaxID=9361 RepID=UPI00062A7C83|nr:uncharacterized protein LOC101425300 isoform X4 [Dasypus novemcinctus]